MTEKCKKIEPTNEVDKILCDCATPYNSHYLEVGDEKFVVPRSYLNIADEIENFEVRDSDIFVVSHPRTGTTWTQEMVWMIWNLDYERAKQSIYYRFPFFESSCLWPFSKLKDILSEHHTIKADTSVSFTANISETPRFIKTHLSWDLLPKDIRDKKKSPKMVYVYRNPKDTFISYYHFLTVRGFAGCNMEDFCKLFIAGRVPFGPYWKSIFGFWERRNEPNILVIRYEDMKKDLRSVIIKVANFLEKTLTEEDILKLESHLSFESMAINKSLQGEKPVIKDKSEKADRDHTFFRKGEVGNFKTEMPPDMIKMFDQWIQENIQDTGLEIDI